MSLSLSFKFEATNVKLRFSSPLHLEGTVEYLAVNSTNLFTDLHIPKFSRDFV